MHTFCSDAVLLYHFRSTPIRCCSSDCGDPSEIAASTPKVCFSYNIWNAWKCLEGILFWMEKDLYLIEVHLLIEVWYSQISQTILCRFTQEFVVQVVKPDVSLDKKQTLFSRMVGEEKRVLGDSKLLAFFKVPRCPVLRPA